jgi:hypothetical protein
VGIGDLSRGNLPSQALTTSASISRGTLMVSPAKVLRAAPSFSSAATAADASEDDHRRSTSTCSTMTSAGILRSGNDASHPDELAFYLMGIAVLSVIATVVVERTSGRPTPTSSSAIRRAEQCSARFGVA